MSAVQVLDALKHLQNCISAPKRKSRASMGVKTSLKEISLAVKELVNAITKPSKALQQSILKVFSKTIVAFYISYPKESLSLSYHTMNFVFKSKIPPKIIETLETMGLEEIRRNQAERDELRESWIKVVDIGVMSGIQTYMEQETHDREAIGAAMYPILISIFKSSKWNDFDVNFRTQLLTILADNACGSRENQLLLRTPELLNGEFLAEVIVSTLDYLVLEVLFELITRITPSTNHATERTAFVKSVFCGPLFRKTFGPSVQEICELFNSATGTRYTQSIIEILHKMAQSDLKRPQILRAEKLAANGIQYPHRPQDLIFIDSSCVIANVGSADEGIEALVVPFNTIDIIDITRQDKNWLNVHMTLSSSPCLQGALMAPPKGGKSPNLVFDIPVNEERSLLSALTARYLGDKINKGLPRPSLSQPPRSSLVGSIDLSYPLFKDHPPNPSSINQSKEQEITKLVADSSPNSEDKLDYDFAPLSVSTPLASKIGGLSPRPVQLVPLTPSAPASIPVVLSSNLQEDVFASDSVLSSPPSQGHRSKRTIPPPRLASSPVAPAARDRGTRKRRQVAVESSPETTYNKSDDFSYGEEEAKEAPPTKKRRIDAIVAASTVVAPSRKGSGQLASRKPAHARPPNKNYKGTAKKPALSFNFETGDKENAPIKVKSAQKSPTASRDDVVPEIEAPEIGKTSTKSRSDASPKPPPAPKRASAQPKAGSTSASDIPDGRTQKPNEVSALQNLPGTHPPREENRVEVTASISAIKTRDLGLSLQPPVVIPADPTVSSALPPAAPDKSRKPAVHRLGEEHVVSVSKPALPFQDVIPANADYVRQRVGAANASSQVKATSNPSKVAPKIPKNKRGAWVSLVESPASMPTRTGEKAVPSTDSMPAGSHSTFIDFRTPESAEDSVMAMEEKRPELESQIEDVDIDDPPIFPAPAFQDNIIIMNQLESPNRVLPVPCRTKSFAQEPRAEKRSKSTGNMLEVPENDHLVSSPTPMPAASKREISLPKVSDAVVSKMLAVRSASFTTNTNSQVLRPVNYVQTRPQKKTIEPTIIISGTSPPLSPALGPELVGHPLTEHKKAAVVIDLTDDKAAEVASSNTRNPTSRPVLSPTIIKPIVNRAPKERPRLSVTFATESTLHSPPNSAPIEVPSPSGLGNKYQSSILMAQVHSKKLPYVPNVKKESREKSKGTSGGSPEFYEEIASILGQISERIVDSKMNEFKSIRHNVLHSRNSILSGIQADLEECRLVCVEHYNSFLELNTQYETAGSGLSKAFQDLEQNNTGITTKIHKVIHDHDKQSLGQNLADMFKITKKSLGPTFEALGVMLPGA